MHPVTIIQCLRKHGQLLDSEIASETGIPLAAVRFSLAGLAERGEISSCAVTRYSKGEAVEGFLCRISGYVPRAAPGRKSVPRKPG